MPSIHSAELALGFGRQCWHEVLKAEYFLELNQEAQVFVCKPITEWTGEDYGKWAQKLWELLPANGSIRKWPFPLLCDIAEWYVFGDEAGTDFKEQDNGPTS